MTNDFSETAKDISKKLLSTGMKGAAVVATLITINASLFTVEAGQYAIEQTPSGKLVPHMTPGIKFKYPFVSSVNYYNEVTTVTYQTKEGDASSQNAPFNITFGDTYSGLVTGSFRVEMPKDPDKFIELHRAFKRYDNFVDNGIEKFTNELLAYTANQFTGETYMQGGQNEYKVRLADQASKGLYVTKRELVKVKTNNADASLASKSGEVAEIDAKVFKNVIQRDSNGKPLRNPNPMEKYGVSVSQVTIDGFIPEDKLLTFINNKKERVQERAKLQEEQVNEREKAITAKLKGDRERVEAEQKMLKEKDAAVIQANKEVELAKLQAQREAVERQKLADLAVIDKKKELQMASDNENIQKANERAAKYEAQAKLHNGLADAEILAAKYKAYDKTLYAMEIQRDTMVNVTRNLQGISIQMPHINIASGSENKAITSIDTVMQALGVEKLNQIAAQTATK